LKNASLADNELKLFVSKVGFKIPGNELNACEHFLFLTGSGFFICLLMIIRSNIILVSESAMDIVRHVTDLDSGC